MTPSNGSINIRKRLRFCPIFFRRCRKSASCMVNILKGETDFTWKEALTVRRIVNPQMSMEEMFLNDEVNKKSSEVDR